TTVVDAVADALDSMRDQGLTRHIGITGLGDARAVIQAIDSGRFDSAQVYYNMINPTAAFDSAPLAWSGQDFSGVLAACARNDVAAMVIRVFAAGVLASEQRQGREIPVAEGAGMEAEQARARAVADVLQPQDGPLARAAIRFALANASVACVVVGMAQLEHLDSALQAASSGPLPANSLEALNELQMRDFAIA
ncbi:MAG: aldo/keto reductase, partial [Gammaproteobacteria bacterium]